MRPRGLPAIRRRHSGAYADPVDYQALADRAAQLARESFYSAATWLDALTTIWTFRAHLGDGPLLRTEAQREGVLRAVIGMSHLERPEYAAWSMLAMIRAYRERLAPGPLAVDGGEYRRRSLARRRRRRRR